MTHDQLVLRAVRWLRKSWHCGVVFAEMVTAARSTPDAIGFNGRHKVHQEAVGRYAYPLPLRSILIECKVSRGDWRRDRKKQAHRTDCLMGHVRYYLTPPGLIVADEIVPPWGLAECHSNSIRVVKPATVIEQTESVLLEEMIVLLSACRRHQLGVEWHRAVARFQPIAGRVKTEDEVEGQMGLFDPDSA